MGETTKINLNELLGRKANDTAATPSEKSIEKTSNTRLPPFKSLNVELRTPPKLAPELIAGVLRCGHKMMISGASKAGKTFLLMELSIAIATGGQWLGFQCKKGKVLYVNFEIAESSFYARYDAMLKALNIPAKDTANLNTWNLRGLNVTLSELVEGLNQRMEDGEYSAIILDPIYKIQSGDENSAEAISAFCNQIDAICTATGSAVIYCHHQSKGNQSKKNAIDRASGSGVFARDADAIIDMIAIDPPLSIMTETNGFPFRVEAVLREFKPFKPINIWFKHPLHLVDKDHVLDKAPVSGSSESNLNKSGKRQNKKSIEDVFDNCKDDAGTATVKQLAAAMGVSEKTVRDRVKESNGKYTCQNSKVQLATK